VSQVIVPKKWELYGRTSFVFGHFRNSYEYAPGVKWYIVGNHQALQVGRRCFSGCSTSEVAATLFVRRSRPITDKAGSSQLSPKMKRSGETFASVRSTSRVLPSPTGRSGLERHVSPCQKGETLNLWLKDAMRTLQKPQCGPRQRPSSGIYTKTTGTIPQNSMIFIAV
jgi:hypothetical protein